MSTLVTAPVSAQMMAEIVSDMGNGRVPERKHTRNWNRILRGYLPVPAQTESKLAAAIADSLESEGGFFRADLLMSVAKCLKLGDSMAVKLAVAVEYYHLASLLLDDMPCMDDAVLRRGEVCIHRKYGEASAILTALALIHKSYVLIDEAVSPLSHEIRTDIRRILEDCLGLNGIVNGQAWDLAFAETAGNAETVRLIALGKTGSLLRLALILPAIAGEVKRYERYHLEKICRCWSLFYQGLDDLKDVAQTFAESGKTSGRDAHLSRPNLARVKGYRDTLAELNHWVDSSAKSIAALSEINRKWGELDTFQNLLSDKMKVVEKAARVA